MLWRRNAKKPPKAKRPIPAGDPHFPKPREIIGVCPHVEREIHTEEDVKGDPEHETVLFEDQFQNLLVIISDDGVHRLYLLCPQCVPESFEEFYLEVYPELSEIKMTPKSYHKRVVDYIKTKSIDTKPINLLFRTHAIGTLPKVGNHVHICDHGVWKVVLVLQADDDRVNIQALADDEDIEQPTHILLCPDCIAEFDPEAMYEDISVGNWTRKDQKWIEGCYTIYQTAGDFFEWAIEKLEEEAEDLDDYEYEGPAVGDPVLLCDHISKKYIVDNGEVATIKDDDSPYRIPKTNIDVVWLAACERCQERTDTPLEVAKKKCRKKRVHSWTDVDQIKLCIEDIGNDYVFSAGLDVEQLANAVCQALERPDWFFDLEGPVWKLSREWAPEVFETEIMPADTFTEEELKKAHAAGQMWQWKREKHPTTHEEAIILENRAVILEDYDFVAVVIAPFEILGLSKEEIDGLETSVKESEEHLDIAATNENGVKFQVVTLPSRGWREFHYLFKDKFSAEKFENAVDDDFDVNILEISDDED